MEGRQAARNSAFNGKRISNTDPSPGTPSLDTLTCPPCACTIHCTIERPNPLPLFAVENSVAMDGKALRRSHDHRLGKDAIRMVNAWASVNRVVLGQVKVDEKSNEITAIGHSTSRFGKTSAASAKEPVTRTSPFCGVSP